MTSESLIRDVSDTALWTAAYRADESERTDALFLDPFARRLAGERGAEIASRVKGQATRFGVVLRTAVLDDLILEAIRERGYDTVLNLAAGLDARPYRLELPSDLAWIEVDLPELIAYKQEVLGSESPHCRLERVRLDLADVTARRAVFDAVASRGRRVLVVTEGLLGYLSAPDVAALATDLAGQPAFREWMTDLIGAQVTSRVKDAAKDLKGGVAPVLFAPAENTAFFRPYGWEERDFRDLFEEMVPRGRSGAMGRVIRTLTPVMPKRMRKAFERSVGVAVLGLRLEA
jgi:methyltransferase (TIGR00027 family)